MESVSVFGSDGYTFWKKNEGRGRKKEEQRSQGTTESQPRIIPYIASLASLVPCATAD